MSALRRLRRLSAWLPERVRSRLKFAAGIPTVEGSLRQMRRLGFRPAVVIDVGAFRGEWTRLCKRIFPTARVLMIEPQAPVQDDLLRLCGSLDGVQLVHALVGAADRDAVGFFGSGSGASVLAEAGRSVPPATSYPMVTVDGVTQGTPFSRPDFVKLDVQGHELEVLAGGLAALASAEAVLMEVNLIGVYEGAAPFDRVVAFMAAQGFRLYDVCTFFRRPYDGALWQMDVIFVRTTSPLVASARWA